MTTKIEYLDLNIQSLLKHKIRYEFMLDNDNYQDLQYAIFFFEGTPAVYMAGSHRPYYGKVITNISDDIDIIEKASNDKNFLKNIKKNPKKLQELYDALHSVLGNNDVQEKKLVAEAELLTISFMLTNDNKIALIFTWFKCEEIEEFIESFYEWRENELAHGLIQIFFQDFCKIITQTEVDKGVQAGLALEL